MEVLDFMIEHGVPMPRRADAWVGQHPDLFSSFQERVNRAAVGVCIRHLEAHGGEWANQATRLRCQVTNEPFSIRGKWRPVEVPGGDPLHPYVVTADAFQRIVPSTGRHPITGRLITERMVGAFKAPQGGYAEGHGQTLQALERVCNVYLEGGDARSLADRGRMAYEELRDLPVVPAGHYANFMKRGSRSSSCAPGCTVS